MPFNFKMMVKVASVVRVSGSNPGPYQRSSLFRGLRCKFPGCRTLQGP